MADHYEKTLEHLAQADDLHKEIITESRGRADRHELGILHHSIGVELKFADIHATLSLRQAVQDSSLGGLERGVEIVKVAEQYL